MQTKKLWAILIASVISMPRLVAANITSNQDGAWNDPSTWSCGCIPNTSDDVILYHDVTSAINQEVLSLGFGTSYSSGATSGTLNITSGTVIINGDVPFGLNGQSNGVLTIASGAKFISTGIVSWQQKATINVNGEFEAGSFNAFNGGGGEFNVASLGTATFTNDFLISAGNHSFNIDGNMNVLGNVSITGGASATVEGALNITGNLHVQSTDRIFGTGTVSAGSFNCNGRCGPNINTVTLPVSLTFFKANTESGLVVITWQTALEVNNDYFELYRSSNGVDFTFIERIDGQGTTNNTTNYKVIDRPPFDGTVYYRLKQVDFDGTSEVFPLVSVNHTGFHELEATIYPIPFDKNDGFYVSGVEGTSFEINVFDMLGNFIGHLEPEVINNNILVNTSKMDLHRGIYVVEMIIGNQKITKRVSLK
ncbi:T9SS type A sorting domain-containing protein [Reichenbachiella versicolor]|uniref:T9SS type A sorting domain-containing protein n=1 Tax=Reichenbachiella versicolor TaxID=1821036 RepID=UPI0013A56D38|nr:T9SS type A sorting domain-containing protein [Reichenbachiella versicolor]